MKTADKITKMIVNRFRLKGYSQVEGYKKFVFVRENLKSVTIKRETGGEPKIPYAKIKKAIEAVQDDSDVYEKGPDSLRTYGITHINSPIWSMLHLLTLKELTEK